MLLELSISDFAIIASSRLSFGSGMHALTGETGAGKSILLDALGAVLGERASVELVRSGEKRARIEALFDLSDLQDEGLPSALAHQGIEVEDSQLILTREIHANGRSVARINGQIVTVSQLSQIGDALVDIHGQSEHFSIRRKDEQRKILDHYAGTGQLVLDVTEGVHDVQTLRARIASLASGERERSQRRDLLAFQVEEIDAASPSVYEDDQLSQELRMLTHAGQLREDTQRALMILTGIESSEPGAVDVGSQLRSLATALQRVGEIDRTAAHLVERSAELVILADELGRDLRGNLDSLDVDEGRLTEVEDRLDVLRTLKRKYGATIENVLEFRDLAAEELSGLTGEEYDTEALNDRLNIAEFALASTASDLSKRRRIAADRLARELEQSIAALQLGNARIDIRVDQIADPEGLLLKGKGDVRVRFDRSGIDDVEFLIAANRGEALRPLGRVASGGETARIMLAIKSIVAQHDSTPTLVFDEIDVGVGGRTAHVVGERLRALSGNRQVIVITHLPQIAAVADHHSRIEKLELNGRVVSEVKPLDATEVEQEIAVMLDGEPVTETSIEAAKAMIRRAQQQDDPVRSAS